VCALERKPRRAASAFAQRCARARRGVQPTLLARCALSSLGLRGCRRPNDTAPYTLSLFAHAPRRGKCEGRRAHRMSVVIAVCVCALVWREKKQSERARETHYGSNGVARRSIVAPRGRVAATKHRTATATAPHTRRHSIGRRA
jgi:hypothetical protein